MWNDLNLFHFCNKYRKMSFIHLFKLVYKVYVGQMENEEKNLNKLFYYSRLALMQFCWRNF